MNIKNIKDDLVIKEAIERLVERVKRKTGVKINFGNFIINMHEGQCANIEFNLKDRCFSSKIGKFHGVNNG